MSAPLFFRSSLISCMNETRSSESSPASTRVYDSVPVRLYRAFNRSKGDWHAKPGVEDSVSFSRENSERTVNRPSRHICRVLFRMILPELVLGIAFGDMKEISATSTLR